MRVLARLGLPSIRGHFPLVLALSVDAVGQGCAGPLMLLFLSRVGGLQIGTAGALLSAAALIALIVPALVGAVIDKVGARNLVVCAQLLQTVAMVGFLFSREVVLLAGCAVLSQLGNRTFWASVFALVAAAADDGPEEDRDRWFALSGMMQGAGFAVGGLLAGMLLIFDGATPFLLALGTSGVALFVSGVLLLRTPNPKRHRDEPPQPKARVLRDKPFLALIVINTVFAVCSVVLGTGLSVYVIDTLEAPRWLVGPLLAINTVIVATCQGVAVNLFRRFRRTRLLMIAGILWGAWGCAMAALSLVSGVALISGLLVGVLLFAAAELLHAPTSMALASQAAPTESRSGYLSYFQYSFAFAVIITPGAFGLLFEQRADLPWLVVAGAAVLASVAVLLLEPKLPRAAVRFVDAEAENTPA